MDNIIDKINKNLISIIEGCLLGDGSIDRRGRFCELHSYKQESMCELLHALLTKEYSCKSAIYKCKKNVCLTASSNYFFKYISSKWYDGYKKFGNKNIRKKIIPADFKLDPISLAFWYLGDGTNGLNCKKSHLSIATNAFTEAEVDFLIMEIKNLGIKEVSKIKVSKKEEFIININKKSINAFLSLVEDGFAKINRNIPAEFLYKMIKISEKDCQKALNNLQKNNTSGFTGVYYAKKDKNWMARPWIDGKLVYLGKYNSIELAILAIKNHNSQLHARAVLGNEAAYLA